MASVEHGADEGDDLGADARSWVSIVRRARLGHAATSVALVLASYADADGTHVYPGVARLAVECELDYRTVRRALSKLRKAGLLGLVKRGNRRRGKSDEYRLVIASDAHERVTVLTPDQVRKEAGAISERQASYARKAARSRVSGDL